jgi:hypothetical protein
MNKFKHCFTYFKEIFFLIFELFSLQPYSEGLYFYQINDKNMQIGKLIFAK